MLWLVLLLVFLGFVFFKLGVLTVWFGVLQGLVKILFFASGAFLVVAAARWAARRWRRRPEALVRLPRERHG